MLDGIRNSSQSIFIKICFALIIAVFIFWGIGSINTPTNTVAEVNKDKISLHELQIKANEIIQNIQRIAPEITEDQLRLYNIERRALDALIVEILLEQESKRTGIDVSAYVLSRSIQSMPLFQGTDGKFSKENYNKWLNQTGQTTYTFENNLRNDLLPNAFQILLTSGAYLAPETLENTYMFQGQRRSVDFVSFPYLVDLDSVNQDEITDFYEENKSLYARPAQITLEFINFNPEVMAETIEIDEASLKQAYEDRKDQFVLPTTRKARHILLGINEKRTEAEALAQIQEIEKEIRAGADFAEMAGRYGEDATAANGGDLGWFSKEQMVASFADAAFALEKGELSKPVKTNFGYHLILLDDEKLGHTQSFEEVKDTLKQVLAFEKAANSVQTKAEEGLTKLLASTNTEVDFEAIAEANGLVYERPDAMSAEAVAEAYGIRMADVEMLMAGTKNTIWDTPITMSNGLAVVKISDITPAMPQSLEEVQDTIRENLAFEKSTTVALAEAEAVLKNPSSIKEESIKRSPLLSRDGMWEGMGINQDLAQAIFADSSKEWKSEAYPMNDAVVIVRLAEISNPPKNVFEQEKAGLMLSALDAQKTFLFQIYMEQLYKGADITILRPEIFQTEVGQ